MGNSEEMSSFPVTAEDNECALDISSAQKEQTQMRAVPEPQLYMPPAACDEGSWHVSMQSLGMPSLTPTTMTSAPGDSLLDILLNQDSTAQPVAALNTPPGVPEQTVCMNQMLSSWDQTKPSTGPQMTGGMDIAETCPSHCEKTDAAAFRTASPSEGDQLKTLQGMQMKSDGHINGSSDQQSLQERPGLSPAGDQTLRVGQVVTPTSHQNLSLGQMMPSTVDPQLCGMQMVSPMCGQTLYGDQAITPTADQALSVGHMMMSTPCAQTLHSGQVMTLSLDQIPTGIQMMTPSIGQTLHGGQMMTTTAYQTFSGGQIISPTGSHNLYGVQMVMPGCDQTLQGAYMMAPVFYSVPAPGYLSVSSYPWIQAQTPQCFASSDLVQGQLPAQQDCNLPMTQHSQLHKVPERLKPYICTYPDCGKSYAKPSHLRIHERRHTGE